MKQFHLESAYTLHRRPYRETSFLVELFTQNHGRLTVVARGVRKAKSQSQGLLQPFTPITVSFTGNGELMTLTHVEAAGEVKSLQGDRLFAGFYLNELLMGLLQKWDPHPILYTAYQQAICALQSNRLEEKILRTFEKNLLEELGYGLLPKSDISLHNTFAPDKFYRFIPDHGFVLSEFAGAARSASTIFSGKSLIAIAKEDWQEAQSLQDAKRLNRMVLTPLLGTRQIHSRKLFMQVEEGIHHEE